MDHGDGSSTIMASRMSVVKAIVDIDRVEALDIAQKAKVRWEIEGDENTKHFHGIVNKIDDNKTLEVSYLVCVSSLLTSFY